MMIKNKIQQIRRPRDWEAVTPPQVFSSLTLSLGLFIRWMNSWKRDGLSYSEKLEAIFYGKISLSPKAKHLLICFSGQITRTTKFYMNGKKLQFLVDRSLPQSVIWQGIGGGQGPELRAI